MTTKEAEKVVKYEDLTIEIQCLWNVKTKVMLVITGTPQNHLKIIRKYLSNITGKHDIQNYSKQP